MSGVIGIDEVGRGCWAGPLLVVAARAKTDLPPGLADSKLLTKKRREALVHLITATCELGQGWVAPAEIDQLGLTNAMKLAVERALTALGAKPTDPIIMDGHINYCPSAYSAVSCIIKADATEPIVSAASIYAKVTRDSYMAKQAKVHPHYQFEKHVGYGTKLHANMLKQFGICQIHRKSFKPIQNMLIIDSNQI